jgi:hypothetical protein
MVVRSDFIPHQIHLTTAQIKKLGSGLSTNLKHSQMGADKGDIVVMLRPQNARKMLTSYKKTKGMRLTMSPDEIEETMKQGTGFFKTLKKWTGINKSDVIKGAKKIGKDVIHHGATAVGTAVGAYFGNPMAGAMLGDTLGRAGEAVLDSVEPTKGGVKFSPKEGVNSIKRDAKKVAIEALEAKISTMPVEYQDVARKAIKGEYPEAEEVERAMSRAMTSEGRGLYGGSMKGSPEMKERMARLRAMRKVGGKVNIGKAFRDLGHKIESGAKKTFTPALGRQIVSGLEKAGKTTASSLIHAGIPAVAGLAGDVLGGPMGGIAGAVAGDMLANQVGKATGYGIRRGRGRPRKNGGALAMMSAPYKQALRLNKGTYGLELGGFSADNAPISSFSTNSRVRPSSSEMTLSPYQMMSSPAMNPFIPTTYKQEGGTSCGYGGRGLYGGGLF